MAAVGRDWFVRRIRNFHYEHISIARHRHQSHGGRRHAQALLSDRLYHRAEWCCCHGCTVDRVPLRGLSEGLGSRGAHICLHGDRCVVETAQHNPNPIHNRPPCSTAPTGPGRLAGYSMYAAQSTEGKDWDLHQVWIWHGSVGAVCWLHVGAVHYAKYAMAEVL